MKQKVFFMRITCALFLILCVSPFNFVLADNNPVKELAAPDKVSLDLKGMDVVEVIKMLATQGNLNVILSNDVRGHVTIFLKNVDLMDAFELILEASNLAYDKRGDIIYVMSQNEYEDTHGQKFSDKKSARVVQLKFAKAAEVSKALTQIKSKDGKIIVDVGSNIIVIIDTPEYVAQLEDVIKKLDSPTVTKVFSLSYARIGDLKAKISESLTQGLGTMQIDERTNKVTVTDLESKVAKIQDMITSFDDKLQQVFIESKILQITLDDKNQLGVDWSGLLNKIHKGSSINNNFELAPSGTLNPGTEIGIATGDPVSSYNIMVQALKTVGDTDLLSSPQITVLNNQEAKILVGTTQPYAINTVTEGSATTTTATTLQFIDIGVKLSVTPVVNRDGFITMKIKPEVSSTNNSYTYGSPPTTVPIVETTQAETTVTVKDGTTIIIAGLIKDQRTSTVNKIPILGDIPFIKNAFQNTNKEIVKQELVIFLTPHIVTGGNDYLEAPQSPPIGENKFTMPEDQVFERRDRVEIDPGMFKDSDKHGAKVVNGKPSITVLAAVPDEYYFTVKEKIAGYIVMPRNKTKGPVKGAVKVQFFLSPKGELLYAPVVLKSSNSSLDGIVINAVVKAAPFPASPMGNKKQNHFVIDFSFE